MSECSVILLLIINSVRNRFVFEGNQFSDQRRKYVQKNAFENRRPVTDWRHILIFFRGVEGLLWIVYSEFWREKVTGIRYPLVISFFPPWSVVIYIYVIRPTVCKFHIMRVHDYGAIACSQEAIGSWQNILQMSAGDAVLPLIDIDTNRSNKWLPPSKFSAAGKSARKQRNQYWRQAFLADIFRKVCH